MAERPALTILGLSMYTSFSREIDTALLLNGFAHYTGLSRFFHFDLDEITCFAFDGRLEHAL